MKKKKTHLDPCPRERLFRIRIQMDRIRNTATYYYDKSLKKSNKMNKMEFLKNEVKEFHDCLLL